MFYYYYVFLAVSLVLIFIIWRSFSVRKKNTPFVLFEQARKLENNGEFNEAVLTYEAALDAVKKIRFHDGLKFRIIEKLRVLNTLVAYQNNYIR